MTCTHTLTTKIIHITYIYIDSDCVRHPETMQESIQKGVLLSARVRHESQVRVVSEGDIAWFSDQRHHQVVAVGQKIISATREMVNDQLEAAMRVVADQLPPDATEADLLRACGTDPTVQLWYHAHLHLQGENSQTTTPWKYMTVKYQMLL